jgi:hypothetical protein
MQILGQISVQINSQHYRRVNLAGKFALAEHLDHVISGFSLSCIAALGGFLEPAPALWLLHNIGVLGQEAWEETVTVGMVGYHTPL